MLANLSNVFSHTKLFVMYCKTLMYVSSFVGYVFYVCDNFSLHVNYMYSGECPNIQDGLLFLFLLFHIDHTKYTLE